MTEGSFSERLADAVRRKRNPLCVGIDPRWESLPISLRSRFDASPDGRAAAFEQFGRRVLELTADSAPVVKLQSAFFEACGPAGFAAQQSLLRAARAMGLVTILDAKRGDIASTASAYAQSAFQVDPPIWDADALTVNPYLGADAVEPFIESARVNRRGNFILVRTSNPGSGLFQSLVCDGRPLHHHVAAAVAEWNRPTVSHGGLGDVGAVVGATHPTETIALRELMPACWFLVPGYGAQGGSAADTRSAFRGDGLGAIVNSSRGITFPFAPDDADWEQKIQQATERAVVELGEAAGLR